MNQVMSKGETIKLYFCKHPNEPWYLTYEGTHLALHHPHEGNRYDNLCKSHTYDQMVDWIKWVAGNDSAWYYEDGDVIPLDELVVVEVGFPL